MIEGELVTLGEKGNVGINRASDERNDSIRTVTGQKVHKICLRDYCLKQNIARSQSQDRAQLELSNSRGEKYCGGGHSLEHSEGY